MSHGVTIFSDSFSPVPAATYSGGAATGNYTVSDENIAVQSVWTATGGTLTYARTNTGQDPNYRYASSVLLTNGLTSATGSTAGLTRFTVSGIINAVPSVNTAQPGLIVSGNIGNGPGSGGFLLSLYNGLNQGPGGPFALLAETGSELVSDEGGGAIVKNFGIPITGHSYSVSVAVDRSGANPDFTGTYIFAVSIIDLTATSTFYSGSFSFVQIATDVSGTQIGYRVRNPLDSENPSFGMLSLSVPPPGDVDGDYRITIDDYLAIDRGYTHGLTGYANGDFNGDGTIDAADYALIDHSFNDQPGNLATGEITLHAQEFGAAYTDALIALNSIPEPATALFMMAGTIAFIIRPHHRQTPRSKSMAYEISSSPSTA